MLRNVFLKTLYDHRRSLLWWAVGLLCYAAMIAGLYSSVKSLPDLNQMIELAPKELMAAFIGNMKDITSPAGYLNSQIFFFLAPLLFLIFAVGQGSAALAGEEEAGTLDLLLANPVSRPRVVLEKLGALMLMIAGLAAVLWGGLAAGAAFARIEISVGRMAEATVSVALLGLVFGALALAIGCATGSRSLSTGVTSALALATYLLNALGSIVAGLEPYRKLSPFYYQSAADPLVNGLNWGHAAMLIVLVVIFGAVALASFQRRDLAL